MPKSLRFEVVIKEESGSEHVSSHMDLAQAIKKAKEVGGVVYQNFGRGVPSLVVFDYTKP